MPSSPRRWCRSDSPCRLRSVGLTQSQADALGLTLSMKLTAWFTVDALAAFALFAVIMVWAFARLVQENSAGVEPTAPDFRREAMPSSW